MVSMVHAMTDVPIILTLIQLLSSASRSVLSVYSPKIKHVYLTATALPTLYSPTLSSKNAYQYALLITTPTYPQTNAVKIANPNTNTSPTKLVK